MDNHCRKLESLNSDIVLLYIYCISLYLDQYNHNNLDHMVDITIREIYCKIKRHNLFYKSSNRNKIPHYIPNSRLMHLDLYNFI